jgi:hypothetical protein
MSRSISALCFKHCVLLLRSVPITGQTIAPQTLAPRIDLSATERALRLRRTCMESFNKRGRLDGRCVGREGSLKGAGGGADPLGVPEPVLGRLRALWSTVCCRSEPQKILEKI